MLKLYSFTYFLILFAVVISGQQQQQQKLLQRQQRQLLFNNTNDDNNNNNNNVQSNNGKLHVLVLYESLCPDSIRFMTQQLGPSYDALKDYIDIELVPFGKSYSDKSGGEFYCQHGPQECQGNRMQSCVLKQTEDKDKQVQFCVCQMAVPLKSTVQYCAETAGLSSNIANCMETVLGTELQLAAEEITSVYSPRFVPTIVYNHVFDQKLQDSSIRNFRGTVCRVLQQTGTVGLYDTTSPCS